MNRTVLLTLCCWSLATAACTDDAPTTASGDTTRPDALFVPSDAPSPPDAAPTSCAPGQPCSDGDACTYNDRCQGGACLGDPIPCDDGLPCTADACLGGACRHTPIDGYCLVDGACYADQQANPSAFCLRCLSATSATSWTSVDGMKCNDADPCTVGESCLAGLCGGGALRDGDGDGHADAACGGDDCDDGDPDVHPAAAEVCTDSVDNDCDGHTDHADDTCAPDDPPCATHVDCYPERVCARWATTGALACSTPCSGPAGCEPGQICSKLPGSAQVGFCQPEPPGAPDASPCLADSDCASGLCASGACRPLCLHEAACDAPTHTCQPHGAIGHTRLAAACAPSPPSALALGAPCTQDYDLYSATLCATRHCDLMRFPSPDMPCAPLCRADLDCAPYQECGVVIYGAHPNPDSVPFHAQWTTAHVDALTACYTRPAAGASPPGTPCSAPSHCASHKCLHLIPDDPQRYCTAYCTLDAECPGGMQCKLDSTTLASAWLQADHVVTQPPRLDAWSLVRVCKFE